MKKLKKILLWVIGSLTALVLLMMFVVWPILKTNTKKISPEQNITYTQGDLELQAFYSSPSKKGRIIFGELVPYNEVWRTGANEATTFSTNKNLMVQGIYVPAGHYTLWTIPKDTVWNIMFNTKQYAWGVDDAMQAMRDPHFDVINIEVPVENIKNIVEQFTIAFDNSTDNLSLTMAWDTVKIVVPLK